MRLLIALHAVERSKESGLPDSQATRFTCLHLIDEFLLALNSLPHEFPKFTFPILHYWYSAVRIGLEMVGEEPLLRQCYGVPVLEAVISLCECYAKTWLSSRISQNILGMSYAARSIFADELAGRENSLILPQSLSSQSNMIAELEKAPVIASPLSSLSSDGTVGSSSTIGAPGDVSIARTAEKCSQAVQIANHSNEQNVQYMQSSNGHTSPSHSQGPLTRDFHHAESNRHTLCANGKLGRAEPTIVHDGPNRQQLSTTPSSPVAGVKPGPGIQLNVSDSLDVPSRPRHLDPTVGNESTQIIASDSHISPADQSWESCSAANTLNCGISELGLDEIHLFTLSHAGLNPM